MQNTILNEKQQREATIFYFKYLFYTFENVLSGSQ